MKKSACQVFSSKS